MTDNDNAGTFGFMFSLLFELRFHAFCKPNPEYARLAYLKRPKRRFFIRSFLVWRISMAYSDFTEFFLKYARGQNTPENG